MALRWLILPEMVAISAPWVTEGQAARTAIERFPLLTAMLPELQKAHGAIFALRAKEDPKLQQLSQREGEIDAKHDAHIRAIYIALTILAPVSDEPDELLGLRDKLFPEGLSHMQKSYRGESGHTAFVASQMDESLRARLKAVTLHKKNLLDLTMAWIDTGKQLGQLEEERARLSQTVPTAAKETQSARNAWIRMAKALMSNAEVAEIDADTDNLLFSALRVAERAAEDRVRSRKSAPGPVPAPKAG